MSRTAKPLTNERSQAVRLPSEFRFEGNEVTTQEDLGTGDVHSSKPKDWNAFFKLRDQLGRAEEEFLSKRDASPPLKRTAF